MRERLIDTGDAELVDGCVERHVLGRETEDREGQNRPGRPLLQYARSCDGPRNRHLNPMGARHAPGATTAAPGACSIPQSAAPGREARGSPCSGSTLAGWRKADAPNWLSELAAQLGGSYENLEREVIADA